MIEMLRTFVGKRFPMIVRMSMTQQMRLRLVE